jgi:hypothetical protein
MKNIINLVIFSIIMLSCKNENRINNELQVTTLQNDPRYFKQPEGEMKYEFQKFRPFASLGNKREDITECEEFINTNGFTNVYEFLPAKTDWKKKDAMYQAFMLKNANHRFINSFRQVGAITILRNHALLAEKDEKAKIGYYLKEFLDAGGMSCPLTYYSLEALKGYWSQDEITKYANIAIKKSKDFRAKEYAEFEKQLNNERNNMKEHEFEGFLKAKNNFDQDYAFVQKLATFTSDN